MISKRVVIAAALIIILGAAALAQEGSREHNTKNSFVVVARHPNFGLVQYAREPGSPAAGTVELTFLDERSDPVPVTMLLQDADESLLAAEIVNEQAENGGTVSRRGKTLGTAQLEVFMGELEKKELYSFTHNKKVPYTGGSVFFELFTPFNLEGRTPAASQLLIKANTEYAIKARNAQLGEMEFKIIAEVTNAPCNDLPPEIAHLADPRGLSLPMKPIDIHEKAWRESDVPGHFSSSSDAIIRNMVSAYPPLEQQLSDTLTEWYGLPPSPTGLPFDLRVAEIGRQDEFRTVFMILPSQQVKKEMPYHVAAVSFSNSLHVEPEKYGPGKDLVEEEIRSYGIEPAFWRGSVNPVYEQAAATALSAPPCVVAYRVVS